MSDNRLSVFGVAAEVEEIYRHFLRNPQTPAADIHGAPRVDPLTAEKSLERARECGLIRVDRESGLVHPADPETAVGRLMDSRLRQLHHELQRVTQTRAAIEGLRQEQTAQPATAHGVEQLADGQQIRERIADLAFFAREEVLAVAQVRELLPDSIAYARPLALRCLRRKVRIREVVPRQALSHPVSLAYLRELTEHGAAVRVVDDVSGQLQVYDGGTALVPLNPRDASRGALLTKEAGLVANIIALFERIWAEADELEFAVEELAKIQDSPPLTETERHVLALMCTVGKDDAGARELGISVRTYRRHISDLLRRLGAANRAHAALSARERGWI